MKRPVVIAAGMGALVVVAVPAYLAVGFAEPENMAPDGLFTPLFVPSEVRHLPLPDPCDEATLSRSWIECGGICGVIYRVRYSSRASRDSLEKTVRAGLEGTGYAVNVVVDEDLSGDRDSCRVVALDISRDSRGAGGNPSP